MNATMCGKMVIDYNGDEFDCGTTMIEKKYYKSC